VLEQPNNAIQPKMVSIAAITLCIIVP